MPESFEELASLDRLVHEPARLAVLTALSACESAEFLFLQRITGLTKGNLCSHLSKLEDAGLIWVRKETVGRRSRTMVGLEQQGRQAVERHWERLEELRQETLRWRPLPSPSS